MNKHSASILQFLHVASKYTLMQHSGNELNC